MKKNNFFKHLLLILKTKKKFKDSSNLGDFNFDSLTVLELIAFKEKYFKKLEINPNKYIECETIKDLVNLFKVR